MPGLSTRRREALHGYLFVSPWIIGFVLFGLGPMVASLWLSMTYYPLLRPPSFVGLENYVTAFREDLFWTSLWNTAYYVFVGVPIGVVGSLVCALLMNQGIKARTFFRAIFFIPSITPTVATSLVWAWVLHGNFGLLNTVLGYVGIRGPQWFNDVHWSKPAMILIDLWATVGGPTMIIFLAGLQGVPQEFYEVAEIDGAGSWRKFVSVTVPMLSPTILLILITGLIGAFRVFTTAYVITQGGPSYSTYFYALHLFRNAFQYMNMGYASALAWFLLAIVLALTVLQLRMSRYWVYYAGA